MIVGRALIGAAVLACSIVATMATVAPAANDPRSLDPRDDDMDRPATFMLGAAPTTPIPSVTDLPLRGNPLWGISLESLHATRERPLFSPSRRPPMPAAIAPTLAPIKAASAPVEPEQPQLNLLGVVTGTADGYAVFLSTTTHDIVRLKTGEGHDGWILQSVSGREVVLEKDHRTAVVSLPQPAGDQK